jgi:hypothetical protein
MHCVELVELAGLVALHAQPMLRLARRIPNGELECYWTASKCRLDRWQLALFDLKESRRGMLGPTGMLHRWVWSLFEEIFTGEILARVWTGMLAGCDRLHGADHAEPIARSVLSGQQEVRCRTLTLLSTGRELPLAALVEVNRFRQVCERWTDFLLAEIAPLTDVAEFAHEVERVRDFASDVPRTALGRLALTRRALMAASLRAAFDRHARTPSPNQDLNARIAAAIVGCFPPELFDGCGVFRSAWLARLTTAADDAQTMLDDYLATADVTIRDKPGRGGLRRF